jgi:hypothetical protein
MSRTTGRTLPHHASSEAPGVDRTIDGVESVFISSVINGLEDIRAAASAGVESSGFRAVMAESAGASPASAQRSFLDLVARSDIYLLLLGPRYGERGESGFSPTEDEFQEANRRRKPIIALRQNVEMEPEQLAFLERVRGGWERGRLYDTFDGADDVALKVVRALTNARELGNVEELAPQAQQRAAALAHGDPAGGFGRHGSTARVALVPLLDGLLLDEVALDDATLATRLADLARTQRLVPHELGLKTQVTRAGVTLSAVEPERRGGASIVVGSDGAVVVEGSVAGEDPHGFGSSRIDPGRLDDLVSSAASYALSAWEEIDPRDEVQHVAVAIGIPDANGKVFGRPSRESSSFSFGGSTSLPQTVVAPDPAPVVRKQDVGGGAVHHRMIAAVRRVFADANALETA